MTSSAPSLKAHWGPKEPARADRRDLSVPSRFRTRVREARAAERANEERQGKEESPGRETLAVPTDRPGTKGMENKKSGDGEETVAGEGKEVARRLKKGRW